MSIITGGPRSGLASVAALAAGVLGSALLAPSGAAAASLSAFGACPPDSAPLQGAPNARCATLTVLEDPARPEGRKIELPLMKIPAKSANPGAPVFVLNGGPGDRNLGSVLPTLAIQKDRDVYYLGYRGADGSVVLDCPEIDALVTAPGLLSPANLKALGAASAACMTRLQGEGYDLSRYSMLDAIADHEAAAAALGVERINLYSNSYGTRLAQFYSRLHPARIYRSVMIGTNPPGHFVFSAYVNDRVVARASELCRMDKACSAQTGDLRAAILAALHQQETGKGGGLDDTRSQLALFLALYGRDQTIAFAKAALAAQKGDTQPLQAMGEAGAVGLKRVIWGDILSKGALDSYHYPALEPSFAAKGASMGSPLDTLFQAVARPWPKNEPPPGFRRAAYDRTETLVLNGDLDVATPLVFVEGELMPYLPNGHLVAFKDYGHNDFDRMGEALSEPLALYFRTGEVDRAALKPDPYRFPR